MPEDSRENETIVRLSKKSKPDEFDEICLRSYNSTHIEELCQHWKKDPNILNDLSDEVIEVIENLKMENIVWRSDMQRDMIVQSTDR